MTHHDYGLETVKFTQPVLIQKLWEEYGLFDWASSQLSGVAGQVPMKGDGKEMVGDTEVKMYHSLVVTCMYMMQ